MSKKPAQKKQSARCEVRSRRSKWIALERARLQNILVLDTCPTTGEVKRRHFASLGGFYKGRQVFVTKKARKAATSLKQIKA